MESGPPALTDQPVYFYAGRWTGVDHQGAAHKGKVEVTARSMASAMQQATRRVQFSPGLQQLTVLTLTLTRRPYR